MRHFYSRFLRLIILLAFLAPGFAFAQPVIDRLAPPTPGGGATLQEFIALLIEIIQSVAIPALALSIIYAGFLFVTARGNEAQLTKAKTWLVWTLVGAAIILRTM